MRLVLSEYVSSLKEDKELDVFLTNLLAELEIIPITKPQRGRQHGVDIASVGPDFDNEDRSETLFLLVVKQGNISRATWSAEKTGVRSTLEEIKDVYLNVYIPENLKNHPIKVVVVTNGELEQNVNINWVNYTKANSTDKVKYDFWGIDKLVALSERVQFHESIFPSHTQSLLRKTLALIDVSEYDNHHFYLLLENILEEKSLSKKEIVKKLRLINLCLGIILFWSESSGNLKPAYIIAERTLLNVWFWLDNNCDIHDADLLVEFFAIFNHKKEIDAKYFLKVRDAFLVENGLAYTGGQIDHTKYCLITYEQIGIVSIIGLTKLWEAHLGSMGNDEAFNSAVEYFNHADFVARYLIQLLRNNPASLYPKFDEHCIEINLALMLLSELGYYDAAREWLINLINYLRLNLQKSGFLPLFITNYEDLAEIDGVRTEKTIESSILLTVLADWSMILRRPDLYHVLRNMIEEYVPDVNLQLWFPEKDTESVLFLRNALKTGKSKVSIKLYGNYKEYEMEMAEEVTLFRDEDEMSFRKTGGSL